MYHKPWSVQFEKVSIYPLAHPDAEVDIAKSAGKISSIRKAFKEAYAKILQLSPADGAGVGGLLRWFVGMNQAVCP